MLTQHEFYVYNEENRVMARMGTEKPVVAETLEDNQAAAARVQSIVNPTGRTADSFNEVNAAGFKVGFHSKEFQDAISGNCEAYVKAAYKKKK